MEAGGLEPEVRPMIPCTQDERRWLLRNLALSLIKYMQVAFPPVWVEKIIRNPPEIFRLNIDGIPNGHWDGIYERQLLWHGRFSRPADLPIDERRYAIAREILIAMGGSRHGRALGLPEFLLPHLQEAQDYFARVLLAPDPLVHSYRSQGKDLRGFAETFLMPVAIAAQRWADPIYP